MASEPSAGFQTISPDSSSTHSPSAHSTCVLGFFDHRIALDVDAPTSEAGGKASVLALLADGRAKREVVDDDSGCAIVFVEVDFFRLGRSHGLTHVVDRVFAVINDVDLFAVQAHC